MLQQTISFGVSSASFPISLSSVYHSRLHNICTWKNVVK
jgi:hypothetical protein